MGTGAWSKEQGGTNPDAYLAQLITQIIDAIIKRKEIQHWMLEKMLAAIINHFAGNSVESNQSLEELSDAVKIAYQTENFTPEYEKGFEMGFLYSAVFGMDIYNRNIQEEYELEKLKTKIEDKSRFLLIEIIKEKDGLCQKDILDEYNSAVPGNKTIKTARLSQLLSELKSQKIIYETTIGKKKCCHLTRRGKYLLSQIEDNSDDKETNGVNIVRYNIPAFSLYKKITEEGGLSEIACYEGVTEVKNTEAQDYKNYAQLFEAC